MDMNTYIEKSSRTAAPNYPIGRELFPNNLDVMIQLMDVVVTGHQADSSKRSLFYKTPNEKLSDRLREASKKLSEAMVKLESMPESIQLSNEEFDFIHGAFGIASEVGEMVEEFLLSKAEGRPMNTTNIKEEVGDVMWYLAMWMRYFGLTFEDCADSNIAKLTVRFPEKFTEDNAHNRNIDEEMKAIEESAA